MRRADPRRARPRRRPRAAQPDVRVPRLLAAVHAATAPAAATSGPCPTATSRSPTSQLSPAQWDALQIPVSVAFFFLNSTLERVAAFYPSPAGATESLLPLDTWDELVAANPELADARARRRGVPRARRPRERPRRECYPRADRRLLRAGRPAAPAVAGLRRRREAHDALDAFFDRRAGEGAMSDLAVRGARRARRAVRGGADAHAATAHHRDERRAGARRRAAVPDPDRAAAPPLRRTTRRNASSSCSASRRSGATRCGRSCGRTWRRPSPAFTGATEVDLPDHVHLRLRGRGAPSTSTARRRRDPARAAVLRHRRSRAATAGLVGRAGGVARRGVVPAAGRRVARHDGPLLPEQRLAPRAAATRSTRCSGSRPRGRCPRGTTSSSSC